jgi:hypothetical protein
VASLVVFVLLWPLLFAEWTLWMLACALVLTLSRYREYVADRGAVLLTGAPENLMSALVRISDEAGQIPARDLRQIAARNAFFIIPVRTLGAPTLDPLQFFPTHPRLDRRLDRLAELARTLGHAETTESPRRKFRVQRPPKPRNPAAVVVFCGGLALVALTAANVNPLTLGAPLGALLFYGSAAGLLFGCRALGRAQAGASGFALAAAGFATFLFFWLITAAGALSYLAFLLLGLVR